MVDLFIVSYVGAIFAPMCAFCEEFLRGMSFLSSPNNNHNNSVKP